METSGKTAKLRARMGSGLWAGHPQPRGRRRWDESSPAQGAARPAMPSWKVSRWRRRRRGWAWEPAYGQAGPRVWNSRVER